MIEKIYITFHVLIYLFFCVRRVPFFVALVLFYTTHIVQNVFEKVFTSIQFKPIRFEFNNMFASSSQRLVIQNTS